MPHPFLHQAGTGFAPLDIPTEYSFQNLYLNRLLGRFIENLQSDMKSCGVDFKWPSSAYSGKLPLIVRSILWVRHSTQTLRQGKKEFCRQKPRSRRKIALWSRGADVFRVMIHVYKPVFNSKRIINSTQTLEVFEPQAMEWLKRTRYKLMRDRILVDFSHILPATASLNARAINCSRPHGPWTLQKISWCTPIIYRQYCPYKLGIANNILSLLKGCGHAHVRV
jgi:hypothetical protein